MAEQFLDLIRKNPGHSRDGLGPVAEHSPQPIVTLGRRGALLVDGATAVHVPAPAVTAVDTTAAGDAFTGALATAVGSGHGWAEAVRLAVAAGALAATRLGAQPSLPTRAEWEAVAERGQPAAGTALGVEAATEPPPA